MEIFVTFVYLIVLNGISTPTIANKDADLLQTKAWHGLPSRLTGAPT